MDCSGILLEDTITLHHNLLYCRMEAFSILLLKEASCHVSGTVTKKNLSRHIWRECLGLKPKDRDLFL